MEDYGMGRRPAIQFRMKRGLLKYLFLSLITFGIYGIVCFSHISEEINMVATRYDHRNTLHYCLVFFVLSWLTFGIYPLIWWSNLSSRMGYELQRRGIAYHFSAGTYWGWYFFGSLILIGPFVYLHKFFKAMNYINADFNQRG